jgi:pimeloyl-ACP methyl ester carboxylesterase
MTAPHEQGGALVTSRRGLFWVGVERAAHPAGTVTRGPMYVEWEAPAELRHPYPIVLIHGGGGQGIDWLGTPDGRPGWATYLVQEGYAVYTVDRPGHGRAAYHPDILGPMTPPFTYELAVGLFMSHAEGSIPHPTAHLHTQWPGSGTVEDPNVDQFVASSGPMIQDFPAAHALEQTRGAELLDIIGPAILMSHSAGGPMGWLVADARPHLVKALVAIEPMGPPFAANPQLGFSLEWGLTAAPISYDPPAAQASDLQPETHDPAEPGGLPVVLQAEPARSLANLKSVPIALVSAPGSLLGHWAPPTVAFLRQAGCEVEDLALGDRGVEGNGHLMMLEKNSREALRPILDWLDSPALRAEAS